jgi:hypothetical protein
VGSSVTVDRTLQNIGMACDPDPAVQAGVHWVSPTVVAPGAIVQTAVAFAAIRITFAADGEFYIVAR